jgi:phosphoglycolate phosphatase
MEKSFVFKLVIWDYDNTLVNTQSAISSSLYTVLRKQSYVNTKTDHIDSLISCGLGLEDTIAHLTGLTSTEEIQSIVEIYRRVYAEEGWKNEQPFKGVHDVLTFLNCQNIINIVVSNKGVAAVENGLDRLGLASFFNLVIGAIPTLKRKPNPMVFETVIKAKYSLKDGSEVLVIGDTEADIIFARNIKSLCCWASYGYGHQDKCQKLNPMFSALTPSDILHCFDAG